MELDTFCDIFCWPYLENNWSNHLPFTITPRTRRITTVSDDCIIGMGRYGHCHITRTTMIVFPMSFIPHNPYHRMMNLKLAVCIEDGHDGPGYSSMN